MGIFEPQRSYKHGTYKKIKCVPTNSPAKTTNWMTIFLFLFWQRPLKASKPESQPGCRARQALGLAMGGRMEGCRDI